ncbi:MAG: DUF1592 domain-containing protein [Myxococcota bacterium]
MSRLEHISKIPSPLALLLALVGCTGTIGDPNAPLENNEPPVPGGPGGLLGDEPPDPESCAPPEAGLRRLGLSQLEATFAQLFPGVPVRQETLAATLANTNGFTTDSATFAMTTPYVTSLFELALEVSDTVDLDAIAPCLAEDANEACVEEFVDDFGRRTFRRPLRAEEQDTYTSFFANEATASGDANVAARQTVRRMLMSPDFLYRTELGAGDEEAVSLTPWELASAISYGVGDAPPDDALLAKAADGSLADPEIAKAEVLRLLDEPERAIGVRRFFREQFHGDEVGTVSKDSNVFPDFDEEIAELMVQERDEFVREVLWADDGTWQTLMTANYTMANETLADFYGFAHDGGDEFVRIPKDESRGLLGQGAFLAALATPSETHIIERGHFIREEVLCGSIPAPPPSVFDNIEPRAAGQSQRDWLETQHSVGTCGTCHRQMDPLGFAFENFDAVGRWRDDDAGNPIDASGALYDEDGVFVTAFEGASEAADVLAESQATSQCVAVQSFEFVVGRAPTEADACALYDVNQQFEESGGNLRELFAEQVMSAAFALRIRAGDGSR